MEKEAEAEELHLLYVGVTRARDLLVFASRPYKSRPSVVGLKGRALFTLPKTELEVPPGEHWRLVTLAQDAAVQGPAREQRPWFGYARSAGELPGLGPESRPAVLTPRPRRFSRRSRRR
jgi:hypothetical protein